MKLRDNKGVTGADLSVALIVIVLFVGIISALVYNFGMASKAVNRKATATNIAISKIEELKAINTAEQYDDLQNEGPIYKDESGQTVQKGPYKVTTQITKYSDLKQGLQDVIKIAKVTVEYSVGKENESIDISTVITKGE